jgi:hypothetical protein
VGKIIETAMFELKKRFEHAKIVFITENVNDVRMKYILKEKKEIFIPDMNSQIEPEEEESFNYYIENVYKKGICYGEGIAEINFIGAKDLDLAQRLVKSGSPHDKFLRQIFVSMDINAPLYWWKEMDTYKVGTVADSESTMHTITNNEFVPAMFSFDNSFYHNNNLVVQTGMTLLQQQIFILNKLRKFWLDEKDKKKKEEIWSTIIKALPCSYMQKRTWTANYSICRSIDFQRTGHKLIEWKELRDSWRVLPYAEEFIFYRG